MTGRSIFPRQPRILGQLQSLVSVTALAVLHACSSPPDMATGTNIQPLYAAPAAYEEHRAQQRSFEIDGLSMAYTDHGTGPAIVLLHGVPTSSWMYRKVIPGLQENMRVITVDLVGFGSSDKPDETGSVYETSAHAGRVSALMEELGIPEYAVLMHDMGGLVAWDLLRENMDHINRIVVLNTIVADEGFNNPTMNPGMMTRQLVSAYSSPITSVAVLTKTFNDLELTGANELSEAECFGYVLPMREGADPALYTFFTSLNDDLFEDLDQKWEALKAYQGDTLVLWGEQDETLTTAQIPMLQEALGVPDDNIMIYPDNAHFLAEEIPDEIVRKVTAFISAP